MASKKKNKKKKYKRRNIVILGMIIANKPSKMKCKKDYDRSEAKIIEIDF